MATISKSERHELTQIIKKRERVMKMNAPLTALFAAVDCFENPLFSFCGKPFDLAQLPCFGGRFQFLDSCYSQRGL